MHTSGVEAISEDIEKLKALAPEQDGWKTDGDNSLYLPLEDESGRIVYYIDPIKTI